MEQKSIFEKNDIDKKRWDVSSKELEEYLGRNIEDVEKEYFESIDSHKEFSNVCKQEKDAVQFYEKTDHYLYELLYWESCKSKFVEFKKLGLFIKKHKIKKILDYGGGIGSLCIYMHNKGMRCDYLDVPGRTSDFASWRFKKRGMESKVLFADKSLPFQEYDLVTSYDVLEHIYNPEDSVEVINSLIAQNKYFICKCSFSGGGLHLTKNEKYQDIKVFKNMMEAHKFTFFGRIKIGYMSELFRIFGSNVVLGIREDKKLKYGGNFLIFKKTK